VPGRTLEPDVVDLGNLLLVQSNNVTSVDQLATVAREDAQLLLNSVFEIQPIKVDDVTVAPLPPPTFK